MRKKMKHKRGFLAAFALSMCLMGPNVHAQELATPLDATAQLEEAQDETTSTEQTTETVPEAEQIIDGVKYYFSTYGKYIGK